MQKEIVCKVTAYITRLREGKSQLLVFREEGFEHIGLQVPGGTVEESESLVDALRREVEEEAGISQLSHIQYLGECSYYSENLQVHVNRHYYVMEADGPDTFTHIVQSGGEDNGWIFHYEWVDMDNRPALFGYLGAYLEKI